MKFEVFARKNAGDDLRQQGIVEAANERLGRVYARSTYDEEDWYQMVIVNREDIIAVAPSKGHHLLTSGGMSDD